MNQIQIKGYWSLKIYLTNALKIEKFKTAD